MKLFLHKIWTKIRTNTTYSILIAIGILVVFVSAYARYQENKLDVEYTTAQVVRGDIVQTVSATGSLQSSQQVDLNFEVSGTIQSINVKVGDQVTEGQMLATLSPSDLQNQLKQAQANLASAQATLNQSIVGPSKEDIRISEQNLASAKVAYDSSLINLQNVMLQSESDIVIAQQNVYSAQADLASSKQGLQNTINTQNQNLASYQNTALNLMDNHVFIAKKSLQLINDILSDPYKTPILGIQRPSTLASVQNSYSYANVNLASTESAISVAQSTNDYDDIVFATDKTLTWLNQVSVALDDMLDVLLYTPSSSNYTESEVSADKTTIQGEQSTVSSSNSTMLTARSNLVNANTSKNQVIDEAKSAVTSAENSLIIAQKNYELALATKQTKIDSTKAESQAKAVALSVAQAQLDYKKAPARQVDLASQQATVARLSAVVEDANNQLAKTQLKAPLIATVVEIHSEVGEQVLSSTPFMTLLADQEYLIEVNISEADIAKVKLNDSAKINFDAFGIDKIYDAKVVLINPAETIISDVVYYEVKLVLQNNEIDLKPGMTANVDIQTDERKNVLFIPQRAVVFEKWENKVRVLKNQKDVEERVITIGLRADNGMVEVLSGLSEGEEVVTFIKELTK